MKRKRRGLEDDDDTSDDDDEAVPLSTKDEESLRDEEEDLVLMAGKHVAMARAQREFFIAKKIEVQKHMNMLQSNIQNTNVLIPL
jgi:hypothetical protein